jgi:hypothetical protein
VGRAGRPNPDVEISTLNIQFPTTTRQPGQQDHRRLHSDDEHDRIDTAQLIAVRYNLPRHLAELLCSLAGIEEATR